MNYKKGIISAVTALALATSASADGVATYLPLTTPTNDGSWVMFGVNGFSDGTASARSAVAAGFSADFVEVEDTVSTDAQATWGLSAAGAAQPATDNMLAVQGLDDVNLGVLKVAAKNLQAFEATEPVRTMYITLNSANPNVKIDYKASMEGQTLELMYGGVTTLYSVTMSQSNTYSNPANAVVSVPEVSTVPKLSNITDVIDYNLGDNPLDARYFAKADHQQTATDISAATSTFYHFDAVSQQWKVWNTNFSGVANDFTAFSKGDAYWGRIDTDDNPAVNDGGAATTLGSGLVLGSSGLSAHDTTPYSYDDNTSKLTDGWNMLALDSVAPYIRRASTGLILTMNAAGGVLTITDSTGTNSITATLAAAAVTATTASTAATAINTAIENAKLKGTLPKSFNLRAFSAHTAAEPGRLALISDAKFKVSEADAANGAVDVVTTLTGANPYSYATATGLTRVAIADLGDFTGSGEPLEVESVYGEYAVILDLMTNDLRAGGVGTVAADLDGEATTTGTNYSAKIAFGTATKDYTPVALGTTANSDASAITSITAKAIIEAHALFSTAAGDANEYGKMTAIDSLNNGAVDGADKVIVASTVPFYVKDATYTRVFEYQTGSMGTATLKVSGVNAVDITPVVTDDATTTADLITLQGDTSSVGQTSVYADDVDTNTKIVAVSTDLSTFDLKDSESGTDQFLIPSTTTADLAKGAVAGVYALDTIAKMPLEQYTYTYDTFIDGTDAGDGATIDFSTLGALGAGAAAVNVTMTTAGVAAGLKTNADRLIYLNAIVAEINDQIGLEEAHGFAYHDFVVADDNFATAKIYVTGMGITIEGVTPLDGAGAVDVMFSQNGDTATNPGTLGTSWTAITSDLTANAIYTPDYAIRGPLYTMRNAGYDVKAILKATTDVTGTIGSNIGWDSIDLTRDESDWFKNNEFNLFSTDVDSGYWVYLETKTADSVTISNPSFTPTYTYYFDNKDTNDEYLTYNIINGGQFTVDIAGFDGEISNAYVSLNGVEVQLKQNGISTEYTANFTKYDLSTLNEGGSGPLSMTIRATDGKGEESLTYDAYAFDYTAPTLNTPTVPNTNTVAFSSDDNTTAAYHVFKEYIPELETSRADADVTVSRVVGSYTATAGAATTNVCEGLTFGSVDNLRVVAADGTGTIGGSNLSDAEQFTYATMLKGAQVLTDAGGDTTKAIIGLRYNSSCVVDATQPVLATDNTGVSLKTIAAGQTARLSYEEISGVASSLSGAWLSSYSVSGTDVIQVQNLEEYAGKPFYVEYGGKMYISSFPLTEAAAIASQTTALALDDAGTFALTAAGINDGVSEGNEISIINNSLAP